MKKTSLYIRMASVFTLPVFIFSGVLCADIASASEGKVEERSGEQEAREAEAARVRAEEVRAEQESSAEAGAERPAEDTKAALFLAKAAAARAAEEFDKAYEYAEKAAREDPGNSAAAEFIGQTYIDQMYTERITEAPAVRASAEKAAEKRETDPDPFTRYDEKSTWIDFLVAPFRGKTYTLGRVRSGETYSIDSCVGMALRRSQRMVSFQEQVKLAEMRIWEARRDLMPSLSFKTELSSGKVAGDSYLRHYKGQKWAFESKWTAFDGFGLWYTLQQAQTNLKTIKLEREKVKNEIVEETKKAYYNLDRAYKNLDMQLENRDRVSKFYDITKSAYEKELTAEVDFLNVKGLNMQTEFQYISAEEDVKLAELVLFQSMNMEPESRINIEPVDRPTELISVGLDNCYRLALANNPNYLAKIAAIEYYELERKMMKAKGYPKVDLHWSAGKMVEKYEPMFLPADYTSSDLAGSPARADRTWEPEWFFGVKTSMPIWGNTVEHNYVREQWAPTVSAFRGSQSATNYLTFNLLDDMAYFSNLQEARAGFERAKYEELKAKEDLIVRVKELFFKYRKALLNIEGAEAKLEHQQKYVAVLAERHRFGELNMPALIEEYEKLVQFEFSLLSSYTDYYISLVELNTTLGVPDYFKDKYESKEYKEFLEKRDKVLADIEEKKRARGEAGAEKYLAKARKYVGEGKPEKARVEARKAYDHDPGNEEARKILMDIDAARSSGR